ncbi:hypothetical protein EYF80_034562 [Liparis tanakae]|uniref:Uncharacterized protein n=1 Tax=Liparis tanakae TaxID=230148 RepID=A0A4Z2GPD5_9TELE|nr:hypothetical protein EYF80_034562 [Liparis tanakae]
MLSLTRHSPASRAASQGSSRPSGGMTRQSPGTSSSELTYSSAEEHSSPINSKLRENRGQIQ